MTSCYGVEPSSRGLGERLGVLGFLGFKGKGGGIWWLLRVQEPFEFPPSFRDFGEFKVNLRVFFH